MYVCICNKVTDKQIHQAAREGASSVDCLNKKLKVGSCCGKCRSCASQVLREATAKTWSMNPSNEPIPQAT